MSLKIASLLIMMCLWVLPARAQVANENSIQEEESPSNSNTEWVASMLNATTNPLFNFVTFNGRIFSWHLRGEAQSAKIIDGINWHATIRQWNGDRLFIGMNHVFKRNDLILNGAYSANGYWAYPAIHILSTENTQEKKSATFSSSFSNTSNTNQLKSIAILYRSGLRPHQLNMSAAIKMEDAPFGVLPNGFKQSLHLFFSVDKKWNNTATLGISVLWNISDQGRAATTTNEAFTLSQQRAYSPNWGWYHQKAYFPSTRQTNVPIVTLRYQKKWNERTWINVNNGIIFGKESQSNLEWTNAADPRPDYYKYLPSYIADTALGNQLRDWYQQHPENLQIHFDKLARINKASFGSRSYYIVNQENSGLLMMHGSILFSHAFKQKISIQTGIHYALDQIHYYNTIKDLLGGSFFYNYNSWMNDDSLALSFQQDIADPDKKIRQGERWGADYTMRSFQTKPWFQVQKQGPIWESAFALSYSVEGLERIGYNQNGLYANSKGSSGFNYFSTADMKAQFLYKLNGRIYFRSIFLMQWLAPKYQNVYFDPDINAAASPYILQESKYGFDFTVFYRAPNLKTSISLFQKYHHNASDHKMFYHDAYALFVYGFIGNINTLDNGVEFVLETSLFQNIKLNYATTFSNSFYQENPYYQFLDVNNLQMKESGLLQIKNLTSSKTPKLVNALSLIYQPVFGVSIGVTTVYAQERPVSMNLFRRSEWVKNKVDPITWGQIWQTTFLEDHFVVNAFVSKFFQLKFKNTNKLYRWSASISARNILNTLIPIISYEQTRFDYLRFNKDKFALKYLMDAGASYSVRIQLQIQ
jgi:hypothetical protein